MGFTAICIFGTEKIQNGLTKHVYFSKWNKIIKNVVFFVRIPCIIDENDAKTTKEKDLKVKKTKYKKSKFIFKMVL